MTEQEIFFNYEMAEMALRGKRFSEAEEKYKEITAKTNSPEAWCGIAVSKYGQLMTTYAVDDVFYCFQKAKNIEEGKISEIETIAIETSMEVIKSLYDLIILTGRSMEQAQMQMVTAALATVVGAISTIRSERRGSVMGTIASAGFTAFSYNEYVNAETSLAEMQKLNTAAFALVDKIRSHILKLVTKELVFAEKFHAVLNKSHEEVTITIPTLKRVQQLRGSASSHKFLGRLIIIMGPIMGVCVFIDEYSRVDFEMIVALVVGLIMCIVFSTLFKNEAKKIAAQADELERSLNEENKPNRQCNKCGLLLKNNQTPVSVNCSAGGIHTWGKL